MTNFGRGRNALVYAALGLGLSIHGCSCEDTGPGLGRLVADVKLDPQEINFGQVPVGASIQMPVLVTNQGRDRLRVCLAVEDGTLNGCAAVTAMEPAEAPFVPIYENLSEEGNWLVEPSEGREFLIRFTPSVEGDFDGKLVLVHNAINGDPVVDAAWLKTHEIIVTGTGVAPQVNFSQTTFDFGDVTVNQRAQMTLTLSNGTQFNQPVSIQPPMQSAVIFGTSDAQGNDTPFGQPYAGEIPGNGSLNITFWYAPPEEGQHMNSLQVSYCPSCVEVVTLQGRGVKPLFALVPDSIDFGNLEEGATATESFVVQNIGNTALTVFTIDREAGTSAEFSAIPSGVNLPVVLQPAEELVVVVTYVGDTPGRDVGRIAVNTNAWDDPTTPVSETTGYVEVFAQSTGPDINPLPPAVNFGTVAINGAPAQRTLLLENAGNADLIITEIRLDTTTPEITLDNIPGLPVTVAPGNTIELRVSYAPQGAGLDMAAIIVVSNDRNEGTLPVPVQGIGGVPTTCSISVAPTQLTFGLVERGTTVVLPVEVRNGGAQPCNVSNIALAGGAEFTIAGGQTAGGPIAPGSSHRIEVSYNPTAYGQHSTQLQFTSDDPAQLMVSVPISGSSAPSDIRVIPSSLDFAVVPVTCRSPNRAITIYNTGSNNVTITDVSLDLTTTREFELAPFNTPASLPAGGSVILNMRYHPMDIGRDSGVLFITIDLGGQIQRVAVPLSGEGQVNPTVTDTFQQLPTPQADVLFVVDNSCSMSEEQSSLGGNLGAFLTFARQEGIDFQIAVTTTDVDRSGEQGRFVEQAPYTTRIVTANTANGDAVFQANVTLGTRGSGDEKGLEAAYLALSDPLINTFNANFLRTDAALAVIIVSDEEDHSARATSFYENFLRNIKGFQNSAQFSLSAIVGTQQPNCRGPGGDAAYAARYIQVAQATGGVVESICNANWGQTLANIGLNSFGLKRQFILSSTPVPSTIAVEVDGVPVQSVTPGGTQRWVFAQATNSVDFQTGSVPQANATISVTYTVACLP